ncbi:unnamed protein product [Oppiella nova]|uniref:Uncharacterized protein n=1 Tax=Oppiella nova TaxID=334625 RepID=A0A7R9QBG2_9ACAR|nr:unnamed protein product [Oppiella nova]CAG2162472.1 unnamed protein product [Oppiella nova]
MSNNNTIPMNVIESNVNPIESSDETLIQPPIDNENTDRDYNQPALYMEMGLDLQTCIVLAVHTFGGCCQCTAQSTSPYEQGIKQQGSVIFSGNNDNNMAFIMDRKPMCDTNGLPFVNAVGLKCVMDISPDFDITKVENLEFGIENLEKRCCTLSVFYDCLVENLEFGIENLEKRCCTLSVFYDCLDLRP